MSQTVRAVFENGVFRPTGQIDLPEHSVVELELRAVEEEGSHRKGKARVYEILSRRYDGGEVDIAARHNEHQP